jgi:hypothetical protein
MSREELVEGIDYYMENGFLVFTAIYLQRRGYCCQSGCRHCPYGFKRTGANANPSPEEVDS